MADPPHRIGRPARLEAHVEPDREENSAYGKSGAEAGSAHVRTFSVGATRGPRPTAGFSRTYG
jgi:hypothetical protein